MESDHHHHQWIKPNVNDQQTSPNCPRCGSSNTKFCYYNNYSLTQPRYFCKGCRRYWTKGGSLRNVPIGGGCRKGRRSGKSSFKLRSNPFNSSKLAPAPPNYGRAKSTPSYVDQCPTSNTSLSHIDLALIYANFLNPNSNTWIFHENIWPDHHNHHHLPSDFDKSCLDHDHNPIISTTGSTTGFLLPEEDHEKYSLCEFSMENCLISSVHDQMYMFGLDPINDQKKHGKYEQIDQELVVLPEFPGQVVWSSTSEETMTNINHHHDITKMANLDVLEMEIQDPNLLLNGNWNPNFDLATDPHM